MSDKHRMNEITLPWPPKALSPNVRVHWGEKSKYTKAYRMEGFAAAHQAGWKGYKGEGEIHLSLEFYTPSKRHHDQDNMIASIKAGLDGIAQSMGVNDSRFRLHPSMGDNVGGYIKVSIIQGTT